MKKSWGVIISRFWDRNYNVVLGWYSISIHSEEVVLKMTSDETHNIYNVVIESRIKLKFMVI